MNRRKPLFSILIPTYNRAAFLPLAIESVLRQTFKDFELIVSNGGSTDNTKDVVTLFDDERIKYVEADTRLSMSDNYQRAFDYAAGEFIIFFSDDDAFVPTMLERVERVIKEQNAKMVAFHTAFYYPESFEEFNDRIASNSLLFLPYRGKTSPVKSQHALTQMFGNFGLVKVPKDTKHFQPFIGNIVCHNSIYNKIIQKTPRLFPIVPVDVYLVAMILGLAEEYYHLSEPLLVWSRWSKNATAPFNMKGKSLRQHYEKLLEGESLEYVPMKFALPNNCTDNALLQAKKDLGEAASYLNVDWGTYFISNFEQLMYLSEAGVDTNEEFQEFSYTLAAQPTEVQVHVRAVTSRFTAVMKREIRKRIPFVAKKLRNLFMLKQNEKPIIVRGAEAGFNNFLECANYLERNLDKFSKG
ncbi:MAG: glycosyltransferase family 2 protein [Pyrinomonadaceae bacterium]